MLGPDDAILMSGVEQTSGSSRGTNFPDARPIYRTGHRSHEHFACSHHE